MGPSLVGCELVFPLVAAMKEELAGEGKGIERERRET
jgi:hypothetical protein